MSTSRGPTVRQRRLGIELRRLRENSRLTGDEVAARLSWSTAKVSRLENARTGARVDDVVDLLKLYGVNGARLDELIALANDATKRGWWEDYPILTGTYAEFIALEAEADEVLSWDNLVFPGLLQNEAYARHIVSGWDVVATKPPGEIKQWGDVRLRRQQVLHGPQPLRMSVVLDESVLRRRIGDARVMADQIDHLLQLSLLPHVTVRVLPLDGPHPIATNTFNLLKFAPAHDVTFPNVVHIESITLSYFEDEKETHMYQLAHDGMMEAALSEEATRDYLRMARDQWMNSL